MRKLTIALVLTAALQIGGLVADGRLVSAPLPGGTELSATLTTVDMTYALDATTKCERWLDTGKTRQFSKKCT